MLTAAVNMTLAAPTRGRASRAIARVGATATAPSAAPNANAEPATIAGDTRPRAPSTSAPSTAPAPMTLVSSA